MASLLGRIQDEPTRPHPIPVARPHKHIIHPPPGGRPLRIHPLPDRRPCVAGIGQPKGVNQSGLAGQLGKALRLRRGVEISHQDEG